VDRLLSGPGPRRLDRGGPRAQNGGPLLRSGHVPPAWISQGECAEKSVRFFLERRLNFAEQGLWE